MKAKLAAVALVGAIIAWIAGNIEAAGPVAVKPTAVLPRVAAPLAPAPVRVVPQPKPQPPVLQPKSQQTVPQAKSQQATPQPKAAGVQVSPQVNPQQPTPKPQQTVSLPQYKPFVSDTTLKLSAPTAAKPSSPQVSVQTTSSVDVPVVSVTKSCDVSTQKCTKSVSGTALGMTVSVAGNGDICYGAAQKGGVGVLYGKASETGCFNVKDGTIAGKGNVSGGVGLGIDGLSVGSTVGVTVAVRTKPDKSFLNSLTTGFPWAKP